MELPTKGSLSEISFIEILKDISASNLTGMLRLETSSVIKVVYLQNGTIAFASSNEKGDRLTEVLKRAGKLTPEQIEHAQARIKPNVSLGKTLVELGYISPKDLLWGARMQVEGILYQLLFWENGTYQILEGPLPKEIVSLGLTIPQIIYAGILQTKDRDWILKHIGSPEAVYVLTSTSEQRLDEYRLPVNDVIAKLDGKRTLEDIAHGTGLDAFEICKVVAALQILGLAEPKLTKPVQIPLVESKDQNDETTPFMEEPPAAHVDVSLGQVLQIPTVEELQENQFETSTQETPNETEQYVEAVPAVPEEERHEEEDEPYRVMEQPADAGYDQVDEFDEEESPWKKVLLIVALFIIIAAGAAFYFYQKSNRETPQVNKTLSAEKKIPSVKKPEPQEPIVTETPAPTEAPTDVSPTVEKTPEVTKPEVVNSTALQLASAGNLQDAAKMWRQELGKQRNNLTIQVEIACQPKTILEALDIFGSSAPVYVVPLNFKGQACYRVLYGTYKSSAQAQKDLATLPAEFLQQPSPPKVLPIWKVLQ
ncbi:MAG TPA: DUF4388 domain-containing protein [Acidobacteriota bacterium]|nr:DUF4388 domain-containing protein [Acidobacteriota bacterium]